MRRGKEFSGQVTWREGLTDVPEGVRGHQGLKECDHETGNGQSPSRPFSLFALMFPSLSLGDFHRESLSFAKRSLLPV